MVTMAIRETKTGEWIEHDISKERDGRDTDCDCAIGEGFWWGDIQVEIWMKGGRRQLCRCVWEHSRERRQEGPELGRGGHRWCVWQTASGPGVSEDVPMVSCYMNNFLSDSKFFIFTALTHQKSAFLHHMIYPKSETSSPNLTLMLHLWFLSQDTWRRFLHSQ